MLAWRSAAIFSMSSYRTPEWPGIKEWRRMRIAPRTHDSGMLVEARLPCAAAAALVTRWSVVVVVGRHWSSRSVEVGGGVVGWRSQSWLSSVGVVSRRGWRRPNLGVYPVRTQKGGGVRTHWKGRPRDWSACGNAAIVMCWCAPSPLLFAWHSEPRETSEDSVRTQHRRGVHTHWKGQTRNYCCCCRRCWSSSQSVVAAVGRWSVVLVGVIGPDRC